MPLIASFIVPHPPLIVPNIGRGEEKKVQKTIDSYLEIASKIAQLKPDTIIISSPHAPFGHNCFMLSKTHSMQGDFSNFGDSIDSFHKKYDEELSQNIMSTAIAMNIPIRYSDDKELDHGTMVPLYFIHQKYHDFQLVRIGLSSLNYVDHYRIGMAIQKAIPDDKRVIYIASGDLSHKLQADGPYGFHPDGPKYDQMIIDCCSKGDFLELLSSDVHFCDRASECGHRSFLIMSGVLDGYQVDSKFYSHEDITGVGYGIFSYLPLQKNSNRFFLEQYLDSERKRLLNHQNECDSYVRLAYKALDEYYHNHNTLDDFSFVDPELIQNEAGVFVTIFRFQFLRGCIGTFLPTCSNIAQEIVQNAIHAATRDFRFNPIEIDELDTLEIHVDVLSTPEDISSTDELDPKRYGVIVSSGYKRGLLLPDLDGIDTVSEQIEIAKNKAGISNDEKVGLQRFEVIRHV